MQGAKGRSNIPYVVVIFLLLLAVGYYAVKSKQVVQAPTETGLSEIPEPEPPSEPVAEEKSVEDTMKKLFSDKYSKNIEDVILTVTDEVGDYAKGGIRFEGELSGAMFLAAKVDGEWAIIFDGQGTIPCEDLDAVNYPVELVEECWDVDAQTSVIRE